MHTLVFSHFVTSKPGILHFWSKLQTFQVIEDLEDGISLTLLTSGQCSAAFAYKAQFFGAISTDINKMVWKI
jgi:hypothetical protein